jgi:hypothetical protein
MNELVSDDSHNVKLLPLVRMVSTLPKELEGELPAPEQIAKLLEGVE